VVGDGYKHVCRLGNLIQVDNTDNTSTYTSGMTYDRGGRKVRMDDPDMGTWRYWYDLAGNLAVQQDARGQLICFFYDSANRLKGKTYPFAGFSCPGSDPGSYDATYTYDAYDPANSQWGKGRRTGMSDGSGSSATWTFDKRGRLTYESKAITGVTGSPFLTQWTYDALNRLATMTYPDSEVVTTGYNTAGLPNSLSTSLSGTPYVGETQYAAWGAVELRKLGAAATPKITVDYTYFAWDTVGGDGRARLKQVTAGTLQDLTYKYDPIGNVKSITDTKAGGTQIQTFSYDDLDRLTSAQAANGTGGTYGPDSYAYSFAGNLTSKAGRTLAYTDTLHVHAVGAASGGYSMSYDQQGQ
jgi:YD repeat-containing protein